MIDEKKSNKIMQKLKFYVSTQNMQGMEQYVSENFNLLYDIYQEYGSGNSYLMSGYVDACKNSCSLSDQYQSILEKEVAGDVLFID